MISFPLPPGLDKAIQSVRHRFAPLKERMNRLSRRERRVVFLVTAVLGLFFSDYAVIHPIQRNSQALNQKITLEEKQLFKNMQNVAQKSSVDAFYLRLLGDIDVPNTTDEEIRSSMLHDIELLARSSDVYLSEVKPQVSNEHEHFREFSVRMQVEGGMDKIISFFAELVKTKKLYYVENFQVQPHREDVNKVKATVSIARAVLQNK